LCFFVEYIGLVEEETEDVVAGNPYDDGNYCSSEVDAEVVGHMESDGDDYTDDCSLSVEICSCVKSEGAIGDDPTGYHMDSCREESSCDMHASERLSLCTDVVDKIGYVLDKTKS
jgi:hypothetical protein